MHATLAYTWGKMFWSYHILNFWFPWLTDFCLNVRNVLKCQNFASLRAKITIFTDIKLLLYVL